MPIFTDSFWNMRPSRPAVSRSTISRSVCDAAPRPAGGWTMTTSALHTTDMRVRRPVLPRSLVGLALLLPALAFLVVFLVLPSLILLGYSVLTQNQSGDIGLPLTVGSYERLIFSPAYRRVVMTTLRVAFFT